MTVRVLVVDDEPAARSGISRLVAATPGFEVAGEAGDGDTAVHAIGSLRPDLVLLDVAMPGCDGFEVVRRVGPERMPAVVFITAHDEWALRAFDVHAVGYVLKPFEDARLRAALVRATASLHGTALANTLEALIASPLVDQRFEVRIGSRVMFVPWTQIDWIEGAGYYSTLHAGEDTHLVRETMQSLERRLDPARFLRVHRSAIVQLDRIRELRNGGSRIVLSTGRAIPVSRSRKGRLLDALGNPTRRRPASASE